MSIPNFIDSKFVDENGNLTDTWKMILSQLFSHLQNNLSQEGIKVPQQTTSNIGILDNINSLGALIYDKDTNELKVNINGTFKVIATL
jgi:phage-related holin